MGKREGEGAVASDPGVGCTRSPRLETVRAEDDAQERLNLCVQISA